MKSIVLFGVLCLWLGGCDHIFAPDKCDSGPFCVTVDKSIYIAGELVRVTFHNHSSRPVFLPDCNNFFLATKAQTGWNERELLRCFVALPPVKVAPEATHKREHPHKISLACTSSARWFIPLARSSRRLILLNVD